jgi:hypothetical protein
MATETIPFTKEKEIMLMTLNARAIQSNMRTQAWKRGPESDGMKERMVVKTQCSLDLLPSS